MFFWPAVLPETLGHLLLESPFRVQSGDKQEKNKQLFLKSPTVLPYSATTANKIRLDKTLMMLAGILGNHSSNQSVSLACLRRSFKVRCLFSGSRYLSDWRFDYYFLKDVVCFYCLEVLVEYGNLLLIVPSWWTERAEEGLRTGVPTVLVVHIRTQTHTQRQAYMKTASLSTTCAGQWKGKP